MLVFLTNEKAECARKKGVVNRDGCRKKSCIYANEICKI